MTASYRGDTSGVQSGSRSAPSRAALRLHREDCRVGQARGDLGDLGTAALLERDKTWYEERLPILQDRVRDRLDQLSNRLGDADWLDEAFSAGDLLMVTVLRRLTASGILETYPDLSAYVAGGEARPAYKRAFDAQLAVFTAASTN
jgi:glutathione S-transferase